MGYTTEFKGQIKIDPPLSNEEREYINKFSRSRRMNRTEGPYFVNGEGFMGQEDSDGVIDHNHPPSGQPSLWCQWVATECGGFIKWDGGEKFYCSEEWMGYLIDHFLRENAIAKEALPFLQPHILSGEIEAQGEEPEDRWTLVVKDNEVSKQDFVFSTPKVCCPHCEEEFYLEQVQG